MMSLTSCVFVVNYEGIEYTFSDYCTAYTFMRKMALTTRNEVTLTMVKE